MEGGYLNKINDPQYQAADAVSSSSRRLFDSKSHIVLPLGQAADSAATSSAHILIDTSHRISIIKNLSNCCHL